MCVVGPKEIQQKKELNDWRSYIMTVVDDTHKITVKMQQKKNRHNGAGNA